MDFIRRFYNLYISKDKEIARRLRSVIGFTPANLGIFRTAFYHKSMSNATPNKPTNERLEFLGDAILSTIVAEYLFRKYPNKNEGFLTKMRSKIVKRQTLNEIAENMGLDVILADYSMTKLTSAMLGNALEALIGAIYIELGFSKTKDYVIKKILKNYLDFNDLEQRDDNFKSIVLEWCHKQGKEIQFVLLSKTKIQKREIFKVAVVVDGKEISTSEGTHKKEAEQDAALKAITILNISNNNRVEADVN